MCVHIIYIHVHNICICMYIYLYLTKNRATRGPLIIKAAGAHNHVGRSSCSQYLFALCLCARERERARKRKSERERERERESDRRRLSGSGSGSACVDMRILNIMAVMTMVAFLQNSPTKIGLF